MMRGLFFILVALALLGGALSGAFMTVQAGQLRSWLGSGAPDLLSKVDPASRIGRGRLPLDMAGGQITWGAPALNAEWRPEWPVTLTADGVEFVGTATSDGARTSVTLQRGRIDVSRAVTSDVGLSGILQVLTGEFQKDLSQTDPVVGTARGLLEGLVWQQTALGDFDVKVDVLPLQRKAELQSLPGGPVSAKAFVTHLSGQSVVTIVLDIDDTDTLDSGLRRAFSRMGKDRPAGGWQLTHVVPLP